MEQFKTVKNNVKSENLKDIVKELERAIIGYNYDDDNEEPKYEESIAERTKMRSQNKETDKKDASSTFAPPDPDSDDLHKLTEMHYTPYSSLSDDDEKIEEETEQTEKVYWKGYDKEGYDGAGYNKWGFNKDGYNKWGFNKDGFNKDRQGLSRDHYNINGYNINGRNRDHYNINGYNNSGYNRDRYNINGYNARVLKICGNKIKNIKRLKILIPQQMLARLPILLVQIKAGNSSRELKSKIRQLLYSLYRSKKDKQNNL